MTTTITAQARDGAIAEGEIPAVFYGPKEEATSIAIDKRAFDKVWKEAGESTIVVLEGVGESKEVLIHEVQWHPITDEVIHVDFYAIERGKKITVGVPIEFTGVAPAEKQGGVVSKAIHELELEVRPSELPKEFVIDLAQLTDMDSVITVGDIELPASATVDLASDTVIASVTEAKEEVEEAPVQATEEQAATATDA